MAAYRLDGWWCVWVSVSVRSTCVRCYLLTLACPHGMDRRKGESAGRLAGDPVCGLYCGAEKRGNPPIDRSRAGACGDLPSSLPDMVRVGYSRDEAVKFPQSHDLRRHKGRDTRRRGRCCVWVYEDTIQCMHVCGLILLSCAHRYCRHCVKVSLESPCKVWLRGSPGLRWTWRDADKRH